jgi:putative ABC transport system permease protein
MIRNYIKIAWRNLRRNKSYAAINIIGLSLSIACGILIFTLVSYHLSFDDFHHDRDRIYRVVTEIHNDDISYTPGVPPPFAKAFRNDYTLSEKVGEVVTFGDIVISFPGEKGNKKFQEEAGVGVADPEFFDIFNFPLVRGDFKTALKEPNTAIVTEKIAKKYFGNQDPIGKIFRTDNKANFKITGILKDIPLNTDRKQEIYVSRLNMKDFSQWISEEKNWGGINSETQVFARVKPGVTAAGIEKAFPSLMIKYYDANNRTAFKYRAQPLSDLHFNPNYNGYAEKKYLWALAFIGLFLIITACVNFINLATAQAINRAREVGIRKVLGSLRAQLFWQFIAETALITLFAIFLGYGLAALGLPYLNKLFETQLTIGLFKSFLLPVFLLLLFVIVVFLSGSYPGLVLSGFQPVVALKGKLSQNSVGGFSLRRILVITQFSISQMLIIGTIVIAAQMHFSKQSDLGFKKDGIVMLPVPINDSSGIIRMQTMRNQLLAVSGTENVSFCMQAPASSSNNTTSIRYDNRPKDELWNVNSKDADNQYVPTFNLKLVAGRNINPSDTL